jgi:hypothetical protein
MAYSIMAWDARQTDVDDDGEPAGPWVTGHGPGSPEGWYDLPETNDPETLLALYLAECGAERSEETYEEDGRMLASALVRDPDGEGRTIVAVLRTPDRGEV